MRDYACVLHGAQAHFAGIVRPRGGDGKHIRSAHGPCSAKLFLEAEDTAAQIELIFVFGHAALKGGHNPALDVFAAPDGPDYSCFAQNAKMFGDVVLRDLHPFRQLAHRHGTGQQFPHDPPSRLVPKGLEKRRAAF